MSVRPSTSRPVRVRFAPSPTGALHLGSTLVAVANAALALDGDAALVLRIDDTDRTRSSERDADELVRLLRWIGIEWSEGPVRQSQRADIYRAALDRLIEQGTAYPCFCGAARLAELRREQEAAGLPPRYDGRCRGLDREAAAASIAEGAPHVLRFAVPEGRDVTFDDLVHGRVTMPAGSFGDPVLCRADGSAGYLLASVVDDVDLAITHVVRGEDHLPNTARQLLLFEALDAPVVPRFAHLPLLRDGDGRKLSKRDPLGTLDELVDEGFLPVTVRRYLAELLGQGPVDLLAPDTSGGRLDLGRVPTGAPRVDRTRLESLGREDMAALGLAGWLEGTGVIPSPDVEPLVAEIAANSPSRVWLRGELRLVFDGPGAGDLPHVLRLFATDDDDLRTMEAVLAVAADELRDAPGSAADEPAGTWASAFLERHKHVAGDRRLGRGGAVLRPLRVALTGTTGGPGLQLVLTAIGAREALRRVQLARIILEEQLGANEAPDG